MRKSELRKTSGGAPPPDYLEESAKILGILGDQVDDVGCDFNSDAVKSKLVCNVPVPAGHYLCYS